MQSMVDHRLLLAESSLSWRAAIGQDFSLRRQIAAFRVMGLQSSSNSVHDRFGSDRPSSPEPLRENGNRKL